MNKVRKERKKIRVPRFIRPIGAFINGSFLGKEKVVQYLPFAAFLTLIMVCYISYGFYTEKSVKDLRKLETQLKDVRSEHLSWQSELDSLRQQSSVAESIAAMGLKETTQPPVVIEVKKED